MNTHPYLRAFLSGIFVPTLVLPFLLLAFILIRLVLQAPFPIERGLIFPMALVPALWGLWNMLHLATGERLHIPIGLHGAILPLLLMPTGATVARCLGVLHLGATSVTWFAATVIPYSFIACAFTIALVIYYLVWKYLIGFVNRTLGIA